MTQSPEAQGVDDPATGDPLDLRPLYHQLNNQLGTILAHAELLEARAADHETRTRAGQVVASVLEAMGTARELRVRADSPRR